MSLPQTSAERLHSLDVQRGIAVLSVVAFHCAVVGLSNIAVIDNIFGNGKLGVQLFFIISAMTMCHMWEQREGESHRIAKFYIRRCMRIVPLFWLAIALYVGVNGMKPSVWATQGMTPNDIGLTALFLHGFSPQGINNVVPGGWSIAVEMTFYVLFPLLINSVGARRWVYLCLSAVLIIAYQLVVFDWLQKSLFTLNFNHEDIENFLFFNFLNQAHMFLFGCFMHFALRDGKITFAEIAAIGLFALFSFTFDHLFPFQCIWLFVLSGAAMRAAPRFAPLERLGQNSYAIYLVHFIVIQGYVALFPGQTGVLHLFQRFAIVALVCYAAALLIHWGIERPLARLTKRIIATLDRNLALHSGSSSEESP